MTATNVATTASVKNAIVSALIVVAASGTFYSTIYGVKDGLTLPMEIDPATDKTVKPATISANETDATFESDERYGRQIRQQRTDWIFDLFISFHKATSGELFELFLQENVPKVTITGLPTVFLRIVAAKYTHPATQQSSSGSSFVYTFSASGRI